MEPEIIQGTGHEQTQAIEQAPRVDAAIVAAATQAEAAVKARYAMALKRPRDIMQARSKILAECKRPGFAEVGMYSVPRGGKSITGPSIRMAETCIRCLGNVSTDAATIYDDADQRIVRVTVTDMESNAIYSKDVSLTKTVERKQLREGQQPIDVRTNNSGQRVYIVRASDDDLAVKEAALVSKALRTLALRLVPGDILEEAIDQVLATQRQRDAQDPQTAIKKLADAFATVGVQPVDLAAYLGHSLDATQPAELARLRGTWTAIRDGELTWRDVLAQNTTDATGDKPGPDIAQAAKAAAERKSSKGKAPEMIPVNDAAKQAAAQAQPVSEEDAAFLAAYTKDK